MATETEKNQAVLDHIQQLLAAPGPAEPAVAELLQPVQPPPAPPKRVAKAKPNGAAPPTAKAKTTKQKPLPQAKANLNDRIKLVREPDQKKPSWFAVYQVLKTGMTVKEAAAALAKAGRWERQRCVKKMIAGGYLAVVPAKAAKAKPTSEK